MTSYQILFWHDIPVQVRAGGRSDRVSRELSDRFQEAIDKAAMAADLTESDAYTDGYRWSETQERDGTAQQVADAVVAELEAQYDHIDWRRTAASLQVDTE